MFFVIKFQIEACFFNYEQFTIMKSLKERYIRMCNIIKNSSVNFVFKVFRYHVSNQCNLFFKSNLQFTGETF